MLHFLNGSSSQSHDCDHGDDLNELVNAIKRTSTSEMLEICPRAVVMNYNLCICKLYSINKKAFLHFIVLCLITCVC